MAEDLPGDFVNNHATDCLQQSFQSLVKDLHEDLESFALDVSNCEQELCSSETPERIAEETALEQVLLHLSRQNERLQQELIQLQKEKQENDEKLQENILYKNCQLELLKELVCKKDHEITELNLLINRTGFGDGLQTGCNENPCERRLQQKLETANNNKQHLQNQLDAYVEKHRELIKEIKQLNENLTETRDRNSHLHDYVQRLAKLLRSQEDHRMELGNKYCKLEKSYDEQRNQLLNMKQHFDLLDEQQKETENVRKEQAQIIHELRQNLCAALEKNTALEQQVQTAHKKIMINRQKWQEYQADVQKSSRTYVEQVQRMQKVMDEQSKKLIEITAEFHKLKSNHDKQNEIQSKNEKMIESFCKWKQAQLFADKKTIERFTQYEKHIKLLLQQNLQLVERYRLLKMEYGNMHDEVERVRKVTSFGGDSAWSQRLDLLLQTSRRITKLRTTPLDNSNDNATS